MVLFTNLPIGNSITALRKDSTAYPVLLINIFVRVPFSGEERVLLADDLTIEECGKGGVLLGQPLDLQIAA